MKKHKDKYEYKNECLHKISVKKMKSKILELEKNNPGNKYTIEDDGKIAVIKRISGRRPHKTSTKKT